MTRLFLAAGVAALAITVPATAGPGKSEKGGSAQVQKDRGAKVQKQRGEARKKVAQRSKAKERRAERAGKAREQRAKNVKKAREQRFEGQKRVAEQRSKAQEKALERRAKNANRAVERREKQLERVAERRRDTLRVRDLDDRRFAGSGVGYGVGGCPPGLAKKPVPCVPPGQVKNFVGQPLRVLSDRLRLQQLPNRLRSVYRDTDDSYYRYGNGYVYRVNRRNDLVSALLPLFGLGLGVGQPFPTAFSNSFLPTGLQPFYPSRSQDYYRYANGYVYEIDGRTGLIEDVDPILGYGHGFGQMMPLNYSAYNVPYQYRSLYSDTPDAYYRYAPGAIYQVDPRTSLITGVPALLAGGMTVGQPLPVGYSAYNVPYQYRSTYYDTPNAMYRYANGQIYRVDPVTQLVTAIVTSILT